MISTSSETLTARGQLLRQLRSFFESRGFLEVSTPCLTADAIVDRFIQPFAIEDDSLPQEKMFLHTSPELAMKRLLVAGMEAIYQVSPVFRRGDRGAWHNVEFSMLEYYRVNDDWETGMSLLNELARETLERGDAEIISYRDLFLREVGFDPFTIAEAKLRFIADDLQIVYPESLRDDKELWIDLIFAEAIQPKLSQPVIVHSFPLWQAQLARCKNGVAQRFELYASGIELANGYSELTDAAEHRARLEHVNTMRLHDGYDALPQRFFLEAMQHGLPKSSGCAVGIDRLLAVKLGATSLDEILPFPIEKS